MYICEFSVPISNINTFIIYLITSKTSCTGKFKKKNFIRYFLHLHFKCYHECPLYPPPACVNPLMSIKVWPLIKASLTDGAFIGFFSSVSLGFLNSFSQFSHSCSIHFMRFQLPSYSNHILYKKSNYKVISLMKIDAKYSKNCKLNPNIHQKDHPPWSDASSLKWGNRSIYKKNQ